MKHTFNLNPVNDQTRASIVAALYRGSADNDNLDTESEDDTLEEQMDPPDANISAFTGSKGNRKKNLF